MHQELRYARNYNALSYERQKDMLLHVVKHCEVVQKRERSAESRGKNWSNSYFFIKKLCGNSSLQKFLLKDIMYQ
jgi:hypothetical protein